MAYEFLEWCDDHLHRGTSTVCIDIPPCAGCKIYPRASRVLIRDSFFTFQTFVFWENATRGHPDRGGGRQAGGGSGSSRISSSAAVHAMHCSRLRQSQMGPVVMIGMIDAVQPVAGHLKVEGCNVGKTTLGYSIIYQATFIKLSGFETHVQRTEDCCPLNNSHYPHIAPSAQRTRIASSQHRSAENPASLHRVGIESCQQIEVPQIEVVEVS